MIRRHLPPRHPGRQWAAAQKDGRKRPDLHLQPGPDRLYLQAFVKYPRSAEAPPWPIRPGRHRLALGNCDHFGGTDARPALAPARTPPRAGEIRVAAERK